MSKFYIATSLSRAHDHNYVRDLLVLRGHQLTYDWSLHGSVKSSTLERLADVAQKELLGVMEADFIIALIPGGHGTHVELGIALGLGKQVILHSQEHSFFDPCEKTCAFYHCASLIKIVCPFEELGCHLDTIKISAPARKQYVSGEKISIVSY